MSEKRGRQSQSRGDGEESRANLRRKTNKRAAVRRTRCTRYVLHRYVSGKKRRLIDLFGRQV